MKARLGWLSVVVVSSLVAASVPASASAAEEKAGEKDQGKAYPIKLERSTKVGDKMELRFSAAVKHERQTTVAGVRKLAPEVVVEAVELHALAETLEVDRRGSEKKLRVTIRKCVSVSGGDPEQQVLPPGAVVIVEAKGGKTTFAGEGGKKLTKEQVLALDKVIALSDEEAPTMDETYGTDKPRKAGESYEPDPEAVRKALAHRGLIVGREAIRATVKVGGVEEIKGRPRLKLTITTKVGPYEIKASRGGQMPEGMTIKGSSRETLFTTFYPLDLDDPDFEGAFTSTESYVIEHAPDPNAWRPALRTEGKTTYTVVSEGRLVEE